MIILQNPIKINNKPYTNPQKIITQNNNKRINKIGINKSKKFKNRPYND